MIADRRGGDGDDFLSMLLSAGPDSPANYTDGRIREEVVAMLFAAHETTALTLTYTLYLLSGAPDVATGSTRRLGRSSTGVRRVQNTSTN